MSTEVIDPIIGLYEQVRKLVEEHLESDKGPFARLGDKYRVTDIEAHTLGAEYRPVQEAYNTYNPPEFLLARLVMGFRVKAVKLPLEYVKLSDEAEVTVELVEGNLVVRRVVFTQQRGYYGWLAMESWRGEGA